MEIRVETKPLLAELNLALGIVESKATIPILSNLLFRAEGDFLELVATDLDVTLRTRCRAEVIEPGAVTVPARKIGSIVKAFLGEEAPLWLKTTPDRKLFLQPLGKRNEYHLQTLPEEDFPSLLDPSAIASIKLDAATVKQCIEEVLVSSGNEDGRFSVRGALLVIEPGSLTMVSTDGHRLTHSAYPLETGVETPTRVLVPKKTLTEIMKLEGEDQLDMRIKESHIFFELGQRLLYSRLMDTSFPAFDKVLNPPTDKTAVLRRAGILEKLRRVSMVADTKNRAVTLSFDASGVLEILARNQETADEGKEYETAESYEGDAVSIGFTIDFLTDFLSVCRSEFVTMKMSDAEHQTVLEPLRKDEAGSHRYVVMPLRMD